MSRSNFDSIPLYFPCGQQQICGHYHIPSQQNGQKSDQKNNRRSVVVICGPVGYEAVHAYRSLRFLADSLAEQGFPTLRFEYLGTGNSPGFDEDSQRLENWQSSVVAAVNDIRERTAAKSVCLIGLRLGATLALSLAAELNIQQLILWAPCVKGRSFSREMKALSLTAGRAHLDDPNVIEGAGFIFTEETIAALATLDMTEMTLPANSDILVLDRDDMPSNDKLVEHLKQNNIRVEHQPTPGYVQMMDKVYCTKIPHQSVDTIINWLTRADSSLAGNALESTALESAGSKPIEAENILRNLQNANNTAVFLLKPYSASSCLPMVGESKETLCQFGPQQSLFGILTEPRDTGSCEKPIVVILNAGSAHHIGPNRLSVYLARDLALANFTSFRMDFQGIGDSYLTTEGEENNPYPANGVDQVAIGLEYLKQRFSHREFIIMGLCSGAHFTFHAGINLQQFSLQECVLINPLVFYWKEGMPLDEPSNALHHYRMAKGYKNALHNTDRWKKLITGKTPIKPIFVTVIGRSGLAIKSSLRRYSSRIPLLKFGSNDLAADFKKILARECKVSLFLATTDPGYDIVKTEAGYVVRQGVKKGNVFLQLFENADHTFSFRPSRRELIKGVVDHLVAKH